MKTFIIKLFIYTTFIYKDVILSENASAVIAFWCPEYSRSTSPVSIHQSRAKPSEEAKNKI